MIPRRQFMGVTTSIVRDWAFHDWLCLTLLRRGRR